ncbi:MAG: c-type cytochrome [Hyphomicrobiaceae bacterium]
MKALGMVILATIIAKAGLSATPQAADAQTVDRKGDAVKGKRIFKRCRACHAVEARNNKIGPHLVKIMGRKAGAVQAFRYSKALQKKAEEGLIWDEMAMDAFLKSPRKFLKGTKMAFAGLRREAQRRDIIAYFNSLSISEK